MRAIFPITLAVSFAAHVLIFGAVAMYGGGTSPKIVPRAENAPTLTILFRKAAPVRPTSAPSAVRRVAARPVVTSSPLATARPGAAPRPALPVVARAEPNPNAHLPAPPPESVLAPVPAPRLDGTKGVVFVLDISGSMYEPYAGATRLAFAREDLSRRVRALRDGTPFAIVLYARRACASGPLVAANDATREAAVRFLMRDVNCDGGTNLPAGLAAARALNTGALVLASDGDLNISGSDLMLQAREILGERGSGPALLVIGIAPRFDTPADHLLQDLADLEDGTYTVEQAPDETALR